MKTVMVFGTFDIVHMGHIQMFKQAKRKGDRLVLVVARDYNVERGKNRWEFHNEKERLAFLKELKVVDQVILGDKTDYYKAVKKIKPAVICLGYDQKISVEEVKNKLKELGLKIRVVRLKPYQEKKNKSKLIKRFIEKTF